MHCKACDNPLSDAEAVSKDPLTNTFAELCGKCTGISDGSIGEGELEATNGVDMEQLFYFPIGEAE